MSTAFPRSVVAAAIAGFIAFGAVATPAHALPGFAPSKGSFKRSSAVKAPAPKTSSAKVDARCKTGARVLCVNRGARKMYYLTNGTIQKTYDVRTGRPGYATRPGQFRVYMKDTNWYSTLYHVNMPYSMFFDGGEAVHYSVEFATKGYGSGSHGCVNMRDWNGIKWLYSQIRIGDKVVVYN